jgi:hypothetical protein
MGQRGIRSVADPSEDPGTHAIDLLRRGRYGRSGIGLRPDQEEHVPRHGGDDQSVGHGEHRGRLISTTSDSSSKALKTRQRSPT